MNITWFQRKKAYLPVIVYLMSRRFKRRKWLWCRTSAALIKQLNDHRQADRQREGPPIFRSEFLATNWWWDIKYSQADRQTDRRY